MNPLIYTSSDGRIWFRIGSAANSNSYQSFNVATGQWEYGAIGFTVNYNTYDHFFDPNMDTYNDWDSDSRPRKEAWEQGANTEVIFGSELSQTDLLDSLGAAAAQALAPNTLAGLSQWVYGFKGTNTPADTRVPFGFSVVGELTNTQNGFFGVALRQDLTRDIVFVFRGTNEGVDWQENVQLGVGQGFTQGDDVRALVEAVLASSNNRGDIYFTGHSLGGALATIALGYSNQIYGQSSFESLTAVTFGTAPAGQITSHLGLGGDVLEHNTTNYIRDSDPLSNLTSLGVPGTTFILPTPISDTLNAFWDNHAIGKYINEVPRSPWALSASARDIPYVDPILIDLDGDGVEVRHYADSNVRFDFDGDGIKDLVSWVSSDDGILVLDIGDDSRIEHGWEIAFNNLIGGANDLEALRLVDGNKDGMISDQDVIFAQLKVWQDANDNGQVDEGEMLSLAARGIQSISLSGDNIGFEVAGARVYDTISITYANGDVGVGWNADLTSVDIVGGNPLNDLSIVG